MRGWNLILATKLFVVVAAASGENSTAPVSTLHLDDVGATFAINLSPDSDDVNFFITAPSRNSYFAIGLASSMKNALILVAYISQDQNHVTVSPRLSTGYTEPPYYPDAEVTIGSSSVDGDKYVVRGTCQGCRTWPGGSLDVKSQVQPFSFALGPHFKMETDDPRASIRRHMKYGLFNMNMIHATGAGTLDALGTNDTSTAGGERDGVTQDDKDIIQLGHGYVLGIAAIIVAPLDLLAAHAIPRHIKLHISLSILYFVMVLVGFAMGVAGLSQRFIKSQNFDTPHQILGFLTVALMCFILVLRFVLRRMFGRDPVRSKPAILYHLHTWGARLIWVLLLVDGGLGLSLAGEVKLSMILYSVLAVASVGITVAIQVGIYYCITKKRAKKAEQSRSGHEPVQMRA